MSALRLVTDSPPPAGDDRDWGAVLADNQWAARHYWVKHRRHDIHRGLHANTDRLRVLVAEQAAQIAEVRAQLPPRADTRPASSRNVRHLVAVPGGDE